MAEIHLNEIYSSRLKDDIPNISYGSLIRWRVKTIRVGNMQIVKAYPARIDYTQPRKTKSKPSREVQKKLNDRNRSEQFRLLLLTNFSRKDLFATLTFAEEPEDKTKAQEKLKYFLKKLRKASTEEVKYLGAIETQNADGEAVRCHIHLVISGRDYEAIKKKLDLREYHDPENEGRPGCSRISQQDLRHNASGRTSLCAIQKSQKS